MARRKSHRQNEDVVNVAIYRVSGKQLFFFKVNPAYCRECDMTVNVVEKALDELNNVRSNLEVKPWIDHFVSSVLRGGYHPPVLLVEKRVVSQGVVPSLGEVKKAVLEAWERKLGSRTKVPHEQKHNHHHQEFQG